MSQALESKRRNEALLTRKWAPILDSGDKKVTDPVRRATLAQLLENTTTYCRESQQFLAEDVNANHIGTSSSTPGAGGIDTFDPVLISMIRRAAPNLIAYDICGVQALNAPTGLVFALKSNYRTQSGEEALFNEANSAFSGQSAETADDPYSPDQIAGTNFYGVADSDFNYGSGMDTDALESLGTNSNNFNEMAFTIDRTTVTAKGRALAAGYTLELQQDLKAVHGLDAESELTNLLSTEIVTEINREIVRRLYFNAKRGCAAGTATQYTFDLDTDSNGRWSVERFKGLHFRIEQEANIIAKETRRGKGNLLVCSSDVASALNMAGVLEYNPQMQTGLNVDDTGSTFAGTIHGRIKVYIDPYYTNSSGIDFAMVGYKGASQYDAGFFYCPYIPLVMVRAVDPSTFQPRIGFKTRYGTVVNPFVTQSGLVTAGVNTYYRRFKVTSVG